jgi:hypothetical protein
MEEPVQKATRPKQAGGRPKLAKITQDKSSSFKRGIGRPPMNDHEYEISCKKRIADMQASLNKIEDKTSK